ncbi:MAG: TMEM143 family protein [Hyphomicrobiaceae bacterium]
MARGESGGRPDGRDSAAAGTAGAVQPIAAAAPAEKFIPVARRDLLERLTRRGMWRDEHLPAVKRLFRYLSAWRHIVYHERLDRLQDVYQPFNPETDVVSAAPAANGDPAGQLAQLIHDLRRLLVQANYTEIDRGDLAAFLSRDSEYGLDLEVDLDEYEHCMVFWRGATRNIRQRRAFKRGLLRRIDHEIPVFRRLFVLLKLKPAEVRIREIIEHEGISERQAEKKVARARRMLPDTISSESVYLKLFKDIPRADMEMMFPNTKVRFRPLDKLKIGVSAGGSTVATVWGIATKLMAAAAVNPIMLAIPAMTLGGVFFLHASTVLNQRKQYMMVLAQNLYFHSLADNNGVITLIASRAEEEDIKEEVLLYTVLAKEQVRRSELAEVKAAVEGFLLQAFEVEVDFDVEDALGRLMRDGIVMEDREGVLKALPPDRAAEHLDGLWDGYMDPKGVDRTLLSEEEDAVGASQSPTVSSRGASA